MTGHDPLVHSMFWSMFVNTAALELVQAGIFVDTCRAAPGRSIQRSASAEDLFVLAERVLGWRWAQALFEVAGLPRGKAGRGVPVPSDFVSRLERELASSIGGASVHILLSKVVQSDTLSLE